MTTDTQDNVRRHREALEAMGRQDLDSMVLHYGDDLVAVDHAQQRTIRGAAEFREWSQEWLDAFSDSVIEDIECVGAGEWTVARFVGRGTNDGRLGPLEPTHQPMVTELCDVVRWRDGKVVEEHIYYDMYGVLAQLGHVPSMEPTA